MKIYKYFIKRNDFTCRRYCRLHAAIKYYDKHKDHHSRSHYRLEDRMGNVLMSNRLITKVA